MITIEAGLKELEIPVELCFCVTGCGLVLLVLGGCVADDVIE